MNEHEVSRTLVKSQPELWAELSDVAQLSRHLSGPFGQIKITRLEPETAVAWEGERVSGTVRLEPSGWGTRVTISAEAEVPSVPEPPLGSPEPPLGPPDPPRPPDPPEPPAPPEPPLGPPAPPRLGPPDPPLGPPEPPRPPEPPEPPPGAIVLGPSRPRLFARIVGLFKPPPGQKPLVERAIPPEVPLEVEPEPVIELEPEPVLPVRPEPAPPVRPEPAAEVELPEPGPDPEVPTAVAEPALPVAEVLTAVLERLGQAHHRPFSRG